MNANYYKKINSGSYFANIVLAKQEEKYRVSI